MNGLSRREFMIASACGLVAAGLPISATAKEDATTMPDRLQLKPFHYRDVKLTGGPLKKQFDGAFEFFMKLDNERLLQPYRVLSGLTSSAEPMGGWYDVGAFAPGHSFGQWVSALSRFAQATSDPAAKEKVVKLVHGFAECLAGPKSFYDGHRFKAYCYDKHVLGLSEAFALAGVSDARDVLAQATDLALKVLPEKALTRQEMRDRPHKDITYTWDESYTLPENLFIAHDTFDDGRYLDLAKRYLLDPEYFALLAQGKNELVGKHAYSHINALSSAARAHLALGDEMHLRAARNGWDFMSEQSFASGGWGPNETFVQPGEGKLFESLASTHNHFETPCGSYAHFKLARYLMGFSADPQYGQSLERMLYNGILSAKAPQPDGHAFYYSDYHAHAHKTYHPDRWPCCSGTYPQVIADYLISMYFHDEQGIYVNLYAPSEVKWNDLTLTQSTDYPESDKAVFRLRLGEARQFSVNFRIPTWAESPTIRVNDEASINATPGKFATINRTWRDGDRVELTLPMSHRTEPIDAQHPETVALMRGPVMMVAVSGELKIPRSSLAGAAEGRATAGGEVQFVPFYKIGDQGYTSYFTQT
jgi:DUF1680 family protein